MDKYLICLFYISKTQWIHEFSLAFFFILLIFCTAEKSFFTRTEYLHIHTWSREYRQEWWTMQYVLLSTLNNFGVWDWDYWPWCLGWHLAPCLELKIAVFFKIQDQFNIYLPHLNPQSLLYWGISFSGQMSTMAYFSVKSWLNASCQEAVEVGWPTWQEEMGAR